jgi:hypothetical protein
LRPNRCAYTYSDTNRDSDADSHSDRDGNCNAYGHADSRSNRYAYGYSDANCYAHSNIDTYTNRNAKHDTEAYPNTQAAPNSGATPVIFVCEKETHCSSPTLGRENPENFGVRILQSARLKRSPSLRGRCRFDVEWNTARHGG